MVDGGSSDTDRRSGWARRGRWLLLAMASGSAAGSALAELRGPRAVAADEVMVVVAARDLHVGIAIAEGDLYAVQNRGDLPSGVFVAPDDVVGRVPRERILANEPVRGERLAELSAGVGLNALVPRYMRAITVGIGPDGVLDGALGPGRRVDVAVTFALVEGDPPETFPLLEGVPVLAVYPGGSEEAQGMRWDRAPAVALLATPDQAEVLTHAENVGRITLSLRDDSAFDPATGAGLADLVGEPRPARVPVPIPDCARPPSCQQIQIIEGGSKRTVLVDEQGRPCE